MDKTVLITGSSRGIGKETALYLAQNGYDIVLHCNKNIDKLNDLKKIIENMVELLEHYSLILQIEHFVEKFYRRILKKMAHIMELF